MSTAADEDERRRRSLEAGSEMLEQYNTEWLREAKAASSSQGEELSDEESFHNDKFADHQESCTNEGMSSRDITHSTGSISEGEGDGDLEGLVVRVAKLKKMLQDKEATAEALNAEINDLRAEGSSPNSSQSQNSSIHGKDIISLYHTKLQQFERAISKRDKLIEDLTTTMQRALTVRDGLVSQLNSLQSMQIAIPNVGNNMNLQEQIDTLEITVNDQKGIISKLNDQLAKIQEHAQNLEMEREARNAEIGDYKMQINSLNEQIRLKTAKKNGSSAESLKQQKQYEARIDRMTKDMQHIVDKFTAETNANKARHQQELKEIALKHESEMVNVQMKYEEAMKALNEKNKFVDRLNKELTDVESKHAKELSVFQRQLANYKKTVKNLEVELENHLKPQQFHAESKLEELRAQLENSREQELNYQKERDMLNEQIKLHKIQLEEITSKYMTAVAILESKESMERSLEQALTNSANLKQENETLKITLDDLSLRYSAAQSLIENSQAHERTLTTRVYDLEKSLSRLSGVNVSTFSELNETSYQTFDEVALQNQLMKQKLEDRAEMERLLQEKIRGLEEEVRKTTGELEQANLTKRSYEKQLKDMKNTCDKLKSEINSLKDPSAFASSQSSHPNEDNKLPDPSKRDFVTFVLQKAELYQQEIKDLKLILEQKEAENVENAKKLKEMAEKVKKSEEECEQLKNGLAVAWAQCAEVEEKLNQTLAINDSRIDISLPILDHSALIKRLRVSKTVENSVNISHEENAEINAKITDATGIGNSLQTDMSMVGHDMDSSKEMGQSSRSVSERQFNYDELLKKFQNYNIIYEKLILEKQKLLEENTVLRMEQEEVNTLRKTLTQVTAEKESLQKEINDLIERHENELERMKIDSTSEIKRMQSLLVNLKEGNAGLTELKAELEVRHAKEMEDLRTYFEQKCLQMEKQYSEEVFSQQSKKMSDNDSEIEELAEDLYFEGAGDCLKVSSISGRNSRIDTPAGEQDSRSKSDGQTKSDLEQQELNIKALQQELGHKIMEIQDMKSRFERTLEEQQRLHEKQINEIKEKAGRTLLLKTVHQHCQTEWDAVALENGELSKLRATYNRQLEEQIARAKSDTVNDLVQKFQAFLSVESNEEENLPPLILELRNKCTDNAKRKIVEMKEAHALEMERIKDEYSMEIARMMDCHLEEINKIKSEKAIIRERDRLFKMCAMLKDLVGELIKYFSVCEEEVNNMLITEVLKRQLSESDLFDKDTQQKENAKSNEMKLSKPVDTSLNSSDVRIRRVHFAPQSREIVTIINSDYDTLLNMLEDDESIAEKLRKELNSCLHRLKSEGTEMINATLPFDEDKLNVLSKKINEELKIKLSQAEVLLIGYQEEMEQLKVNNLKLQRKLLNAENKKEIITEGYGENDDTCNDVTLQEFSQLHEKARHVLSNGGGDCSDMLQIIEEFCRQSDKLMDDAKKEREDLQQQVPLEPTPPPNIHRVCCRKIDAADKQLKSTRRFLEEQANEREIERDECSKQIQFLQEQLKEREREKERDLRITSEASLSPESPSDIPVLRATDQNNAVEALENQMREMSSLLSDTEAKKSQSEIELKTAVEKIWALREIITDLEKQLQNKSEKEESLQLQIAQLETVIAAQTKNQHELVQELDSVKMGTEIRHLNEHINRLQEELRKYKLSLEHLNVNSSALKQMKQELRDMQNHLDKRIKGLESTHTCGSNLSLSQPSEDISIREQIDASRCITPDDPASPPTLPLDQILKLKEKMLKHARIEDVAFKKIKDLEMQLTTMKNQNEELQAEQEILQQTTSEQLFQIEAMRGRLEQHKQSAPFAQRQATSRLELQLHEANTKFQSLERTIADKELELKDLKSQLDRANQLLLEKEAEIANVIQLENATIQKLKDRVEIMEEERKILQSKVENEHALVELPQLIDMLADKNEEIDHLKEQLSRKEKQLDIYSTLTLDDPQLRELMKQTEPKNSARTLSDILSIHSECEEISEAIRAAASNSVQTTHNMSTFKIPTISKDTLDISTSLPLIDSNKISMQIPPLDLGSHSQSFSNTCPQRSHVSLNVIHSDIELKSLSPENISDSGDQRSRARQKLSRTEDSGKEEDSDNGILLSGNNSHKSIAEQTRQIQNLESQLNLIKEELQAKTIALNKRESEIAVLQKKLDDLQNEFKETIETLSRDKYFYKNQYELSQASESKIKVDLQQVENTLKLTADELQEYKAKMQINEKTIVELNTEKKRLKKYAEERDEEQRKYTALLQEQTQELQNIKDIILEKDITIETIQTRNIEIENENKQLYEFKTKYQLSKQELMEYQTEIQRLTEGLNNRDQIIRRLEEMARRTSLSGTSSPSDDKDQEIHHLQEYLKEKDKVIQQMSDDSKSLQRALETIQNKMKESGNVVELRRKLKEEQKMKSELKDVVEKLRKELDEMKELSARRSQDDTDIEDMVQRELNLSARLDRQIMSAIESDPEESMSRRVERHSCPALNLRQVDQDQLEKITQKYIDVKLRLSQANKLNEELKKLKDDLEIEKELSKCQIAEYEDRILQLKADLSEESKRVGKLDEELSYERNIVRTLKIQIEKEQRMVQSEHMQDTELIKFLQAKLKSSLQSEEKLRNDLSQMRQEYKNSEIQLSTMKEHIQSQKTDRLPRLTELLETEQRKYISLMEDYEKEQRNNTELQDTLKRIEMERNRYEKQLEIVVEEKEKLVSSLALVEGVKEHLETDLKRTKEELKVREKECEWLQKKLNTMFDAEAKRQEQRTDEHNELKALRREVNNAREVMMDLEADTKQSKRELTESVEREHKLAQTLETLKEREAELWKKISIAKEEEKKLKEIIGDLQQDLKVSTKRVLDLTKELENRYSNEKNVSVKLVQKIKELNDINEKYTADRSTLRDKLIKAREEKEQLGQRVRSLESQIKHSEGSRSINIKNIDTVEKLQHLYGKYLRVDSRRKSLAYQKRYLLCVIGGYQLSEKNTLCVLAQLTQTQKLCTTGGRSRKTPRVRFRAAALVIISIHRIKWIVTRWRIGKRVGANAILGNVDQSFIHVPRNTSNHSPPVRDRMTTNSEDGLDGFTLEQYYQRFRNIQQTLGLAMAEPGTGQIITE